MRVVHLLSILVAGWLLSGCAGVKIEAARELGGAGVKTSTSFADTATNVGRGLDRHEDLYRFDLQLDYVENPTITKIELTDLKQAIAARKKMAKQLASAYAAFFKLAEYDAAKELSESVDSALQSANELATSLSLKSPLSDKTRAIVGELARLWADYDQAKRLHEASILVRESLEVIQSVFDAEKLAWASPIRQAAIDRFNVIDDLMEKGRVVPGDDYFERYLALSEVGLHEPKVDPKVYAACKSAHRTLAELRAQGAPKAKIAAALNDVLAPDCLVLRAVKDRQKRLAEAAVRNAEDWLEATSGELAELQALHVAFEADVTLDAATLESLHQRAKEAADRLSKALGGDS